jgi:hypothetical protein
VFGITDHDVCCEAGEEGDPLRGACSSQILPVCQKYVYNVETGECQSVHLEVERYRLTDGSRIHDALYFNREEPATPATCCLALNDYETNIQVCNFEEETRTEYTYEDGVCIENVITMTILYTNEEEK